MDGSYSSTRICTLLVYAIHQPCLLFFVKKEMDDVKIPDIEWPQHNAYTAFLVGITGGAVPVVVQDNAGAIPPPQNAGGVVNGGASTDYLADVRRPFSSSSKPRRTTTAASSASASSVSHDMP